MRLMQPYPGAKGHFLLRDVLDDPDRLKEAVLVTAKALPDPKPRVATSVKAGSCGK